MKHQKTKPNLTRTMLFCSILFNVNVFSQNTVLPPKIVKTIPEFGDWKVDTNLKEIIIEFDQDMQPGYSVLDNQNGVNFNGNIIWRNSRIISIPVLLKPNRLYIVPMNSSNFRGFSNVQGIPLNPTELIFHTNKLNSIQLKEYYANAYNKFCNYFLSHYSYKDLRGINWKSEFEKFRNEIEYSESDDEFGIKLLRILRKANDPHLSIIIEENLYNASDGKIVPLNFNTEALLEKIGNSKMSRRRAVLCGTSKKFGYIAIRTLHNSVSEDINFAIEQLQLMKDLPNLIIDLRMNGGGNDILAKDFVSNLISDSVNFEKIIVRSVSTNKFDSSIVHSIKPSKESIKYNGNIYILIGGQVMSSAESFVLMFKQLPNVTLVGSCTYESSGNPQEYVITDRIKVFIPSWQAYDINGNLIEGNGIQPNIKLEYDENDFKDADPLFTSLIKTYIDSTFDKQVRIIKPINFPVLNEGGTVKDFEGNVYKTVKIGDQIWMAENLKSTIYSDGKPIEGVRAYNNDTSYIKVYGCLYDWKTAMHESAVERNQGVCPIGWHVPSDKEWMKMIDFMGGIEVAGGKMKETGIDHWAEPNEKATNEFGFTAIPAGRNPKHILADIRINTSATWWSSNKADTLTAWSFTILNKSLDMFNLPSGYISRYADKQSDAYSIRCIKDAKK